MAEKQIVDLSQGGIAVVLCGNNGFIQEYANNAAIKFIDCKETHATQLSGLVPENTRVAIVTEGVGQYHLAWITTFCNRKKIPYLHRKSNQAIYETIRGFFPVDSKPTVEEVKTIAKKGQLKQLIQFIDFSKSNTINGKILYLKARELEIKTTEASLVQLVSKERRIKSGTAMVKSARPQLDVSVDMLDQAIKGLTDMRDFLIATVEENRLLKSKMERYKKALED